MTRGRARRSRLGARHASGRPAAGGRTAASRRSRAAASSRSSTASTAPTGRGAGTSAGRFRSATRTGRSTSGSARRRTSTTASARKRRSASCSMRAPSSRARSTGVPGSKAVARVAVPRVADWCAVHVAEEDGTISSLAIEHADPAKAIFAREVQERYPPRPDNPRGAAEVIRSGTLAADLGGPGRRVRDGGAGRDARAAAARTRHPLVHLRARAGAGTHARRDHARLGRVGPALHRGRSAHDGGARAAGRCGGRERAALRGGRAPRPGGACARDDRRRRRAPRQRGARAALEQRRGGDHRHRRAPTSSAAPPPTCCPATPTTSQRSTSTAGRRPCRSRSTARSCGSRSRPCASRRAPSTPSAT